jgi:hypothetical protein
MKCFVLLSLMGLFAGAPLAAQDTQPSGARRADSAGVDAASLETRVYVARFAPAEELAAVVARIHGRQIAVRGQDGVTYVPNLVDIGSANSVLVYDDSKTVERIVEQLSRIDALYEKKTEKRKEAVVATEIFPLRHVSAQNALRALAVYQRQISVPDSNGNYYGVPNMMPQEQTNSLVVREQLAQLADIKRIVLELDRENPSAPQVTITCWVIEGKEGAAAEEQPKSHGRDIPEELAATLTSMTGYDSFDLIANGIVRTGVQRDHPVEWSIESAPSSSCKLQMTPSQFNPADDTLTLDGIRFSYRGLGARSTERQQTFSTNTSVRSGEYTVIGALGKNPVFVVLRMLPAK